MNSCTLKKNILLGLNGCIFCYEITEKKNKTRKKLTTFGKIRSQTDLNHILKFATHF